jgi:NodT family efflux transporter outer membrane factor (OMF) lipoprotein
MKVLITIALSVALAGCAVGPNYRRPTIAAPTQWNAAAARGTKSGAPVDVDQWWQSFHDAELDSLIRRAVAANYDLAQATARVEEARAAVGQARSNYNPQINANTSATRDRQVGVGLVPSSGRVSPVLFPYETTKYSGDLSLSWELDLFGRIRRGVEAAKDDLAAYEQDRRNVIVALLGDVGRYYANLRGDQLRLEIAEKNIAIAMDTRDLTRDLARAGQATERDAAQAEAQLEVVCAQVPVINTNIQMSIHRLGVLLGEMPGALEEELATKGPIPPAPPEVPTGVPSDLLKRRPDIQRAEAQLAAATARVGEAKADYFPRFTLSGNAGREAQQLHDLTLGLGNFFSVGPAVSVPVFTGGKIRSNVAVQDARVKEALAAYHSAILNAFEETENALVSFGNEQDRRDRLSATIAADQDAFELTSVQYRAGLSDFLTVLDAQRELYANQDLLAQSQTQVTSSLIGLYKALGGGWSVSVRDRDLAARVVDADAAGNR